MSPPMRIWVCMWVRLHRCAAVTLPLHRCAFGCACGCGEPETHGRTSKAGCCVLRREVYVVGSTDYRRRRVVLLLQLYRQTSIILWTPPTFARGGIGGIGRFPAAARVPPPPSRGAGSLHKRVSSACLRVSSACLRVSGACLRVSGACLRVSSACLRVSSACLRVSSACLTPLEQHVMSANRHYAPTCTESALSLR